MKKIKLLALIIAMFMIVSVFTACKDEVQDISDGSDTGSVSSDSQSSNGDDEEEIVAITIADAKGSAGLTGDFKAVFASETGSETVVTGTEQNSVPYSVYASLSSPTVISKIVFTAPKEDQTLLAAMTVDASVDGETWTNLVTLGKTITAGKTYTLATKNTTEYLYVRVRQADDMRTEAFKLAGVALLGIARGGNAGDISKIKEEQDISTLIGMTSYVHTSTKSGEPADVFKDNANSWVAHSSSAGNPNYLIATMTKKTEIRKITVKMWDSNRQPRGTVIQASDDGVGWTDLYAIPDLRQEDQSVLEKGEYTWYVNDESQYSFIRLVQRSDLAPYEWTLNTVLIYGVESSEAAETLPRKYIDSKWVYVSYHDSNVEPIGEGAPESVWDVSDTTTSFTHNQHPDLTTRVEYSITGKLVGPTVITEIIYYSSPLSYTARVRSSYFEASVDGENWTKIATLTGNADAYQNSAVLKLTVDDDTAYNYIRIVQGETFYKYYWTIGTISVKGVCDTPNPDGTTGVTPPSESPTEPQGGELLTVSPKSSTTNIHVDGNAVAWDNIWTKDNEKRLVCVQKDSVEIIGEFSQATVIGKVELKLEGHASRTSFMLSASVDGETWVDIKNLAEFSSQPGGSVVSFDVSDTTAYKYVRLSKDATGADFWTGMYYICFYAEQQIRGLEIPFDDPDIKYVGRWTMQTDCAEGYWSGTYFEVKFTGSVFKLGLAGLGRISVIADGMTAQYVSANSTTVDLSEYLDKDADEHIIRVATADDNVDCLSVRNIVIAKDGKLLAHENKLLVEFVGDSITAGSGYTPASANTYANKTAELLNVDYAPVAIGGIGLVNGGNGNRGNGIVAPDTPPMSTRYFWTKPLDRHTDNGSWDFSKYTPDLIVINLGTNDSLTGVSSSDFTVTYVDFVKSIREVRGEDVPIIMMIPVKGFMKDAIIAAFEQLNDDNVYLVDATSYITDDADFIAVGNVHPSISGHSKIAEMLSVAIEELVTVFKKS